MLEDYLFYFNPIEPSTVNLDSTEIIYRAEGNANIVLSLRSKKKVIRIRKSLIDLAKKDGSFRELDDNSDQHLMRSIEYTKYLSALIGFSFPYQPKFVRMKVNSLSSLNQDILEFRPVNRLAKEVRTKSATLYPDVAFLPDDFTIKNSDNNSNKQYDTVCVEIKPKQGWTLLDSDPENDVIGCLDYLLDIEYVKKCRYCSFQYVKLKKAVITKVSKYCPLDLFSGQSIRMLRAIKGLVGSPQNNFRVFKNGELVYGDKIEKRNLNRILEDLFSDYKTNEERKTIFINLIKEALLKDFSNDCDIMVKREAIKLRKDRKKNKHTIHKHHCESIKYKNLPESCVLKRILKIQLLLKYSLNDLESKDFDKMDTDEYVYLNELLEKAKIMSMNCKRRILSNSPENNRTANYCKDCAQGFIQDLTTLERYMLGATALDCSLMIAFSRITQEQSFALDAHTRKHVIRLQDMWFIVNITVMDLDPKSLKHFDKYFEKINNSHIAYKEFLRRF